jgi:diaminopimelate decarboxylase
MLERFSDDSRAVLVQFERMQFSSDQLGGLAAAVGTPFWFYDAAVMRQRIADIRFVCGDAVQPRFAMKACPNARVLQEMERSGVWIDAVSGNEVLRALRAGYQGGANPPKILFTADVFRDNALEVVLEHGILPNVGSPGMIRQLREAGYRGGVSVRVNPGFGHGHVNACDTGGPSSKHGVWPEDLPGLIDEALAGGMRVEMLHAHIGSGPRFAELHENLERLTDWFAVWLKKVPGITGISLGGGIPHNYRDESAQIPLEPLRELFARCAGRLREVSSPALRVEIEPGRYFVASSCALVSRVTDLKQTRTNEKGNGAEFIMVDAGFVDLVRPAMYGSFHRITVVPKEGAALGAEGDYVVAGPLCESGDVFTRDDAELLQPRRLARPVPGDFLVLHDAGAYGYAMSSNYNSIGRAPQVWVEGEGKATLVSRRETVEDIVRAECSEAL